MCACPPSESSRRLQVAKLRQNLEADERQALEEKRKGMMNRQRELADQIATMGPRLPGAFSAICKSHNAHARARAVTQKHTHTHTRLGYL